MGYWGGWDSYPPYVSVAERQASARKAIAKLEKKGRKLAPVRLEGRTIASTFWGKAWCRNLERYSDIENRIARGRSYVRSGSVIDLSITPGRVEALVQGTSLYEVTIKVTPVERARYRAIVGQCSGKIESVIELLQGKLSSAVMEVITQQETGLFPAPRQIEMDCSCPDGATMCKHVAAVLYGIGARLDHAPELLFTLRGADAAELVSTAAAGTLAGKRPVAKEKALGGDLAGMFGIDIDLGPAPAKPRGASAKRAPAKATSAKPVRKKPSTAPARPRKRGAAP